MLDYPYALLDIIDAVYAGELKASNDINLLRLYGHGKEYFSSIQNQFNEIIANFTDLKVNNQEQELQMLKDLFGDDFHNMLETTFNDMVK